MKFVSDIRLLLLGSWLGAAVFFIAVAQSAFAVLSQRELAGAVVGRTLSVLNYAGLAVSIVLILTSFILRRTANKFWLWAERVLLILIAASCAIGQFVIGLMLVSVRGQMGGRPIDEMPADDPLRIQFNNLHEASVWVLIVAMGAALIAFFIIANRRSATPPKPATTDPYNFEKEFKI